MQHAPKALPPLLPLPAVQGNWARVYLSHLKSYAGMGTARVVCVSGCACEKSRLDGTWSEQATLMQASAGQGEEGQGEGL